MEEEVLTGTLPPKGIRRYGEMGQFIVDSWALGSPLGTAVIALENEYRAL